jgi:hypothetical protein
MEAVCTGVSNYSLFPAYRNSLFPFQRTPHHVTYLASVVSSSLF